MLTEEKELESRVASITHEESVALWYQEYERLEAMPKDKLIRMIIGDRPC